MEAAARRCSAKKLSRKILQSYTKKDMCRSFFFSDVAGCMTETLLKSGLVSGIIFFCEFCKIFQKSFVNQLRTSASGLSSISLCLDFSCKTKLNNISVNQDDATHRQSRDHEIIISFVC